MSIDDEIQRYWGEMLVKIPAGKLSQWLLPAETRAFLETVGLPIDKRLDSYFMSGLEFHPNNISSLSYQGEQYIRVGVVKFYDANGDICLKEDSGECFLIDHRPNVTIPIQFVNSNIRALLLFFKICFDYTPSLRKLTHEMDDLYQQKKTITDEGKRRYRELSGYLQNLVQDMRQKFLDLDAKALSSPEVYTDWSMYLDDFR